MKTLLKDHAELTNEAKFKKTSVKTLLNGHHVFK